MNRETQTKYRGTKRFIVTLEVDLDLDQYAEEYGTEESIRDIRDYVEGNVHSATTEAFRHLGAGARIRIKER